MLQNIAHWPEEMLMAYLVTSLVQLVLSKRLKRQQHGETVTRDCTKDSFQLNICEEEWYGSPTLEQVHRVLP